MIRQIKKFVLVSLILTGIIIAPLFSLAQDSSDLTNPGLTPDSFWYFGEIIKERIFVIFTFQNTAKVEKYIDFSEERIAEIELMRQESKYREATVATDEFISLMDRAQGTINTMDKEQIDIIRNEVNQETSFQIYYLNKIIKSTSDQILKPKLQQAKIEANRLRQLVRQ